MARNNKIAVWKQEYPAKNDVFWFSKTGAYSLSPIEQTYASLQKLVNEELEKQDPRVGLSDYLKTII